MMTNASVALHHADLELAELVISGKSELMALCDDMDQRCAQDAATAIECRDPVSADRLTQDDEEVDALRRRTFRILFSKDWSHGVEPAVDAALIGRYYERFADHAVAIARQVGYFVTGLAPER
jgi:phosphate transport system protein